MGIIFVAALGFGALPGVPALGLHSAGTAGEFISEAIEQVASIGIAIPTAELDVGPPRDIEFIQTEPQRRLCPRPVFNGAGSVAPCPLELILFQIKPSPGHREGNAAG